MNDDTITEGVTNIFADLGFTDACERQTKTRLAFVLNSIIRQRRLKQTDVAKLLCVPQPRISDLKNYRLDEFSVERLLEFLTAFDRDIEIMIRPRSEYAKAGQIFVHEVR
ncbi:MAG: helix-turn-helix domain-containing protein [Syntrophobacteraceae bacterium]